MSCSDVQVLLGLGGVRLVLLVMFLGGNFLAFWSPLSQERGRLRGLLMLLRTARFSAPCSVSRSVCHVEEDSIGLFVNWVVFGYLLRNFTSSGVAYISGALGAISFP